MYSLIAQIFRKIPITKNKSRKGGVPRSLLESAEARAGFGSAQVNEMRQAAFAYLRVVR
ncbi:hypothetical protein [Caenimonas sp. SL110]|uniref:hypothetical protein n=1 Tax=Caenimonas sp. SL110 TaxID=1450524 RepID=UPI0013793748|nr:hypothetical protein [Caenimonas sp. SL110]